MSHLDPVTLSRLQFAATALYHFLFVPLTLGLSLLLAIMESVYVMTGREIWRDMTQVLGQAVRHQFRHGRRHRHHHGIPVRHQLGLLLALCRRHFRRAAGDRRADGVLSSKSTFVGLFFFGWDRLSKLGHLAVTWLVALGSNLSALWILIANGWMQNPVGARIQSRHDAHGADLVLATCSSIRWRRPSSCTRSAPAMSPARCSCWRSRPITCCAAAVGLRQALDHGGLGASAWPRRCRWSCSATRAATPSPKTRR